MNELNEIKKLLSEKGINENITLETKFQDLNLDSLDLINLIIDAEKRYNIRIPDDKLSSILTVADLLRFLKEKK